MAPAKLEPYRFTIEEYLKMGEAEIISPEERVELIDGQVVTMSPIGNWDYASVSLLYRALADQVGGAYCLSPKGGLNIGRHTQLVPDMVVAIVEDPWVTGVRGEDCLLVVEVALSSLSSDRTMKKAIYASEGVPEYWIVDLAGRAVEVYRDPENGDYTSKTVYGRDAMVSCVVLSGVSVPVSEITPPVESE